jgi:hypothetical protein
MRFAFNKTLHITLTLAFLVLAIFVPAQSVEAASIDVSIGNTRTSAWTIGPVKPGDSGHEKVVVRNTSAYIGSVTIWLSNITGSEGTPAIFGLNPSPGGDLKENVELDLSGAGLTANFALPSPVINFPQSDMDTKTLLISGVAAGASVTLNWYWKLPYTVGNEVQGDGLAFDINYGFSLNVPSYRPLSTVSSTTPVPTPSEIAPQASPTPVSPTPPGGSTAGLDKYIELKIPQAEARATISDSGLLVDNLSAMMPDGSFALNIMAGTLLQLSNENRLNPMDLTQIGDNPPGEILVTILDAAAVPEYPAGWIPVSSGYDISAVTNGYITGLVMDQPATLIIKYDDSLLPVVLDGLAMFYYSYTDGWVQLDAPPGFVVEGPQIMANVSHFSLFTIMAKVGTPNPPAEIIIQKLTLNPPRIEVNQSADVKIRVVNNGGMVGESVVTVTIDGTPVKSQLVSLKPGETTEVNILVKPDSRGTYTIAAGSLQAELVVNASAIQEAPGKNYWWLLFIILGILVVALAVFLRRRRIKSETDISDKS